MTRHQSDLLIARMRAERTRGRARRIAGRFALAAGLVGLGGVATDQWRAHTSTPQMQMQAAHAPGVKVGLTDKPWGTEVSLDAHGLPNSGKLTMWVVGPTGKTQNTATWLATKTGDAKLKAPAAMRLKDLERVIITSADGKAVAKVDVRSA